jgi:transposase
MVTSEGIDLNTFTVEQAHAIYDQGREAIVSTLMEVVSLANKATSDSPSTPSSQKPVYTKPNTSHKKRKRPGRKAGHEGSGRPQPEHVDRTEEHPLETCPICGGLVAEPSEQRTRIIEDIPHIQPEVVKHVIHRCYCKQCQKLVEPVVPDALPQAQLGHRAVTYSAWLHYGLGNTISQIIAVYNAHLHFKVSAGGLLNAWHRVADILTPWYDQIATEALSGAVLHADETGHRVNGQTYWLWCFANPTLTYYMIDRSRGHEALQRFFCEEFKGTLVTDFWPAYDRFVGGKHQMCLVHLLRELEKVDQHNTTEHWIQFRDRLKRLLKDAIRLWKREDCPAGEYASKRLRLQARLDEMIQHQNPDPDAKRLSKRLAKYRKALFTFLDEPGVPFDNNHAEREIRPAVLIRKNSFHNMSPNGAHTQSILMTIYRTLKLRGQDPIETIVNALRHYLTNNFTLPPLPPTINLPSDG